MKILLVEDDAGISSFIIKGLEESAYAVDHVSSGEDALYQTSINTYDVIVLDIMLPGIDGFEVCSELRKHEVETPVLMLTARDAINDRIEGLDSGADDYLTKPFAYGELLARIRALLRRRENKFVDSRIEVGDFDVDSSSQRVWKNRKEIKFTTKEFTVFEYFARNANRVISREEISEHCWNETYDVFSNAIEVFVNRIRKKIDSNGVGSMLETRRGAGYVLRIKDNNADS